MSDNINPAGNRTEPEWWLSNQIEGDNKYTLLDDEDELFPMVDAIARNAIRPREDQEKVGDIKRTKWDFLVDLSALSLLDEAPSNLAELNLEQLFYHAENSFVDLDLYLEEIRHRHPKLFASDKTGLEGILDAKQKWENDRSLGKELLLEELKSKNPQLRACLTLEDALLNKDAILEIEELESLAYGDLHLLPSEIGQLTNLRTLILSSSNYCALPPEFGQLSNLKHLLLDNNQFRVFPLEVTQLKNLKELDLLGNKLETLPPEIGRLTKLKKLDLEGNQLRLLPAEIRHSTSLEELELGLNANLNGLPIEIFELPPTSLVHVEGCGLSMEVLGRLRNTCNTPGYSGPRFLFSMDHMEQQRPQKSTEELLEELFSQLNKPYEQLSNILGGEVNQGSLQTWLHRLSYIKDFQGKPETKQWLINNVIKYLKLADQDPEYRMVFSSIIDRAAVTCGDRVALSIIHLGIHAQLATIDLKDTKKLAQFLARGVWAMSLLENIARNKVETLPFFDEIEVYLAYPVMLKEGLDLPIDVEGMLYYGCSEVKQEDLSAAAEFVTNKLTNAEELHLFLIEQEKWIAALTEHFPQEVGLLMKYRYDGASSDDPDYEKLQREWTEGLIQLTKRALE